MRYRAKAAAIEAFQITEESAIDWSSWPDWMLQLATDKTIRYLWSDGNPDRSMVWAKHGVELIKWNSWIVKDDEQYRVMENSEFQHYYEPIPQMDPKDGRVNDIWFKGRGRGLMRPYGGPLVGMLEVFIPEGSAFPCGTGNVWVKYVNKEPPDM